MLQFDRHSCELIYFDGNINVHMNRVKNDNRRDEKNQRNIHAVRMTLLCHLSLCNNESLKL